jgi:hypothetical protein
VAAAGQFLPSLPPELELPRRPRAEQILHEVVPAAPRHVRLVPEPVLAVGEHDQIEVLVRRDERVHEDDVLFGGTLSSIEPWASSSLPRRFSATRRFAWLS